MVNVAAEDKENQLHLENNSKDKKNVNTRIKRSVLGDIVINIRKAKRKICKGKPLITAPSSNASDNHESTGVFNQKKENLPITVYPGALADKKSFEIKRSVAINVSFKQRQAKIKRKRSSIFIATKVAKPKNYGIENPGFDDVKFFDVSNEKKQNTITEEGPSSHTRSLVRKISEMKISEYPDEVSEIFHEYKDEIYKYLRSIEVLHQPKKQLVTNESERTALVEWLSEVTMYYGFQTETLYLAVSYLDRFLLTKNGSFGKLPLAGISAMFIATKLQETGHPRVLDWIYMSEETYAKDDILKMEWTILKNLSCDILIPTPLSFLAYYCENLPKNVRYLAMYLCELTLLETDPYFKFLPSYTAAVAVALAQHTLEEEIWPRELIVLSGYRLKDLKFGICCLSNTFEKAANQPEKIIQRKYDSKKYENVSHLAPRYGTVFDWF